MKEDESWEDPKIYFERLEKFASSLGYKYDDGSSFPYRSLIAGLKQLNIKTSEVNKWVFTCL